MICLFWSCILMTPQTSPEIRSSFSVSLAGLILHKHSQACKYWMYDHNLCRGCSWSIFHVWSTRFADKQIELELCFYQQYLDRAIAAMQSPTSPFRLQNVYVWLLEGLGAKQLVQKDILYWRRHRTRRHLVRLSFSTLNWHILTTLPWTVYSLRLNWL